MSAVSKDTIMTEMRNSVRFPLHLPIAVRGDQHQYTAEMRDISSGGVLFSVDKEMLVGSDIEFTISLPAGEVNAPTDVRVHCAGRVTRTYYEGEKPVVAAIIDEYAFIR